MSAQNFMQAQHFWYCLLICGVGHFTPTSCDCRWRETMKVIVFLFTVGQGRLLLSHFSHLWVGKVLLAHFQIAGRGGSLAPPNRRVQCLNRQNHMHATYWKIEATTSLEEPSSCELAASRTKIWMADAFQKDYFLGKPWPLIESAVGCR